MSKPLAVVTGASTGIGREIALLLAARSYNLLLIARRADKLAETAKAAEAIGAHATVHAMDITREGAADEALTVARRHGSVEVLVNNAGFGMYGAFAEADRAMLLRMIDLNVRALTDFLAVFLPVLVGHKKGYVLNTASTAAFQPLPFNAAYSASKSYVLSLGEAVAEELKGTGVSLTTLCPGPTESEFWDVGGYTAEKGLLDVPDTFIMSAAEAARAGVNGLFKKKRVVVPGLRNRAGAVAGRLAPRGALTGLVSRVIRPRKRS